VSRRLAIVLAVILGAIAFLVVQGLGNATTFFRNADEAVAERDSLGTKRFRLQGIVLPGTIDKSADGVDFVVEWNCATVPVTHEGGGASFTDGVPVVLEGSFAERGDTYVSDKIINKHTEEYRTDRSERAQADYEDRCNS
jgi:cytochrome c-type biogenesis protein CcmE